MTTPDRRVTADAADVAALIERAGAALGLGEEPSNFSAALEAGAHGEGDDRE